MRKTSNKARQKGGTRHVGHLEGPDAFDEWDRETGLCLAERCRWVLGIGDELLENKEKSGRKRSRTDIVRRAFAHLYPENVESFSRLIDRFTDICDDLHDDHSMKIQEKQILIASVAHNLWEILESKSRERFEELALHLRRMIYIQAAEHELLEALKQTSGLSRLEEILLKNYLVRSMVLDVFTRVAAIDRVGYTPEALVKAGRLYLAVDLLNKDIRDIEHDRENGTLSPILILQDKGLKLAPFVSYLWERVGLRFDELKNRGIGECEAVVVANFRRMAEEVFVRHSWKFKEQDGSL